METQAILRAEGDEQVVLEGVSARGRVAGLFLELTVEQRYRNASDRNIEAVYTFPVPWGAVLMSLEFDLDGKSLAGIVVPRASGEARYEEAIDKGDTAVLLETAADGLYTANVGNLMPGESAVVRYRYAQLLRFEKGQVRLVVPNVIAPRYGSAAKAGLAPHQQADADPLAAYPFEIAIEVTGELAAGSLASPTHAIAMRKLPEGVEARLARKGWLDRDFVLGVSGLEGHPLGMVARDGEGYVALASFCPAFPAASEPERRSVKILVDCSGSMAGDSIAAAKRSLHAILSMLEPRDRFSLSRFGSDVQHFHRELQPVNDLSIGRAGKAVMEIDANMGGTELAAALSSTLKLGGSDRADVLLVTDGQVWQADEVLAEARASGARLFIVGIGSAPSESMLRRLGEESGGACEFVAPGEDVEGAITRMFLRIAQEPARDVRVDWPGVVDWEVPPAAAIFHGETVHAFARLEAPPAGDATLRFVLASGAPVAARAKLGHPAWTSSDLPRLAAAMRLSRVDEAKREAIAIKYQLVTEHTNCVLVHERKAAEQATTLPELATVRPMLAAGWGGVGSSAGERYCLSASAFAALGPDVDLCRPGVARYFREASSSAGPRDFLHALALGGRRYFGIVHRLPTTLDGLRRAGVPARVIDELQDLVDQGCSEAAVVGAFLSALSAIAQECGCSRQFVRGLRSAAPEGADGIAVEKQVKELLGKATADSWGI